MGQAVIATLQACLHAHTLFCYAGDPDGAKTGACIIHIGVIAYISSLMITKSEKARTSGLSRYFWNTHSAGLSRVACW